MEGIELVEINPVGHEYLSDITYKVNPLFGAPDERFKWIMAIIISPGEN